MECNRRHSRNYHRRDHRRALWSSARKRAADHGVPFTIEPADIVIPEFCPILDIPLGRGKGRGGSRPGSPTLDRIWPELGYIPGNVAVISHRANTIKGDATCEELTRVLSWVRKQD